MFLFSLLPYKFGWADVELFFKMFGAEFNLQMQQNSD